MDNIKLFQKYCNDGNLNEAKQLLQIDSTLNIYSNYEFAFRLACKNGYLDLAQWLQTLLPDKYNLIIKNNKIISYYINQKIPFSNNTINFSYNSVEELVCPICYDEIKFVEIQTNCGHNFCESCITDYYNIIVIKYYDCKCPYCRQDLTCFSKLQLQNNSISLN